MATETTVDLKGTIFTYSPKEQDRLARFAHLLHFSNLAYHAARRGAPCYVAPVTKEGQVLIKHPTTFIATERVSFLMNRMAFNLYRSEEFGDPKMKLAADDILKRTYEEEHKGELTQEGFDKMWEN